MAKKKPVEKVSQKEAEKMIESGEAQIPAEAIEKSSSQESDFQSHPKFAKFKKSEES